MSCAVRSQITPSLATRPLAIRPLATRPLAALLLGLAGFGLAGCQTTSPDIGTAQIRPAPKPAHVAQPSGLAELLKLDQNDLTTRFGRPAVARREGQSVFWRYSDNRCALILYFPAIDAAKPGGARPTHGVVRWFGPQTAGAGDADCVAGFDHATIQARLAAPGV